jgi:predicted enzyme related to lactoylglutathione lyase
MSLLTESGSIRRDNVRTRLDCGNFQSPSPARSAMTEPNFVILYVNDATAAAAFYADLLGRKPVEAAPTFAMFALESGVMLGLWTKRGVEPAATAAGGSELGFSVESAGRVDALCSEWRARGLEVIQAPTEMDFGRTFVALDPDGHRLRVFAPR